MSGVTSESITLIKTYKSKLVCYDKAKNKDLQNTDKVSVWELP